MKYTWVADGDANFYTILKGPQWFARVQLNGEMHTVAQEQYMDILVSALNN